VSKQLPYFTKTYMHTIYVSVYMTDEAYGIHFDS